LKENVKKYIGILFLLPSSVFATQHTLSYNKIQLAVQEVAEISNDTAVTTLSVELEDSDPKRLANHINQTVNQALQTTKNYPQVTVKTGSQYTYPLYNQSNQRTGWRTLGQLVLKSQDFVALSQLIGELQHTAGSLQFNDLQFSISETAREQTEAELTQRAIQKFKAKANLIGKGFHSTNWRLVNMEVSTPHSSTLPVHATRMKTDGTSSVAVAPQLEGGKSQLQVMITGTIQLRPIQ
jgi:predicted secreted protein